MRLTWIALTALALAGCERKAENAADAAGAPAPAANAGQDVAAQVAALKEDARQGVFLRAVRDAGLPCRDVIKTEQLEATAGTPTWRAQCDQGDAHLILIKPNGAAEVVSRRTP